MGRLSRHATPVYGATAVLLVLALMQGCGGAGHNGTLEPAEKEVEVWGLGGPPKDACLRVPTSSRPEADNAQVIPPTLSFARVYDTVPQGNVSWYRLVAQDAPYQIITCLSIGPRHDCDLYVLGPVAPRGQPGSLALMAGSCRWFRLADWVAIEAAQVSPGDACYIALHGYANTPGGNHCSLEYCVPTELRENQLVEGSIGIRHRQTWFYFEAQAGECYQVTLKPLSGDPDVYVYAGDSGGCVGWSTTLGRETVSFRAPADQTIFVRVVLFGGEATDFALWQIRKRHGIPSIPPQRLVEKVMVVAWDAVQRNHLHECLARSELPNLAGMIARGQLTNTDVRGHLTDTKAGWAEVLTGYGPGITGVFCNWLYQPIPPGLTVFERAKAYYSSQGKDLKTIAVTGKDTNLGSGEGCPYFYTAPTLDVWEGDVRRTADEGGPLMLDALDQYGAAGPFFAFFHFADPDKAGHRYGENSRQYNDAIVLCDEWLGRLTDKIRDLGIEDETRIFVVTDHGFDEGATLHNRAPDAWLVSDVKDLVTNGGQEDVAPTLYAVLGVPFETLDPPLVGRSLVRRTLYAGRERAAEPHMSAR